MHSTKLRRLIIGLGLAAGLTTALSGCEQPEEPLTPPAASGKAATDSGNAENRTARPRPAEPYEPPEWTTESADAEPIPVEELVDDETDAVKDESEPADEGTQTEVDAQQPDTAPQPVALFPSDLLGNAAHICFFSFNTSSEYYQLKRMVQRLNETSDARITVTEYQVLDENPYDSFVALLESGKQCDGIVLSGHHTDEFYGERSSGDLEVDDLEELACNPRYAAFFANIKALWLQGCNTAKPVFHNEDVDEDERITGSPLPLMQRRLDADDMEDTIEDMADLLEENINEENLVNYYMRVFSGATVYGWSFKAPGEEAGAQKSIPYHIAQVSRLVDNDKRYYQNPLQTRIPDVAAERYSHILYGLLKRPSRPDQSFPERLNEDTFIQGWRDHGNYRYKYAFDNHDIEAFPALVNSDNEVLRQLKGLMCLMRQLDGDYGDLGDIDDMNMLEVADYILRDRYLTTYNSYLLMAMLRSLSENSSEYRTLKQRLSNDDHLITELRHAAQRNGYSQADARSFLAMLDPPPAKPAKTVVEKGPAPEKEESPAEPEKAGNETVEADSNQSSDSAETASSSKEAESEPWYLDEETPSQDPSQDDEEVYEFDFHG